MRPARRRVTVAAPPSKPYVNPFPFRPATVASLTVGSTSHFRSPARLTALRARLLARLALDRERRRGLTT